MNVLGTLKDFILFLIHERGSFLYNHYAVETVASFPVHQRDLLFLKWQGPIILASGTAESWHKSGSV